MTKSASVLASALLAALLIASVCIPVDSYAQVDRREQGNLVIENIPEIPDSLAEAVERYENIRSASLQGWLPDGDGVLITTRFGEVTQVHRVDEPGGARRQLTFFEEPVGGAAVSPSPEVNGFLFSKDVGGSEFYQIFFYDLATGEYRMLTDGESRNGGATWADDGQRFAFYTTKRTGSDFDIHIMEIGSDSSEAVLEEGGAWFPLDWSPDGTRLLVTRYVSINESYPHILDLESGDLTALNRSDEKVAYGDAVFDAAGTGMYYTSDADSEFRRLRYRNLETGADSIITSDIDWDVEGLELAPGGGTLAFTVNEGGYGTVYRMDTQSGAYEPVPGLPQGLAYGLDFSPDGERLGMVLNTPQSPGDVYALDLSSGEPTRWTNSEVGGLSEDQFVAPELIQYETFDTVDGEPRTIPAWYYKPEGPGPHPVLLDIHGGPESQERPGFNSTIQYLVNEMGIAVLAPNVRGSAGYGKSYLLLDNGMKREDSVKDIGALLDWIGQQDELDAAQVAVYGGSYGGYMVLASMTNYNDRLCCGVDIVGISNFVTFLENTEDYRRDLRRAEYGDERDPEMREFLLSISPTENAEKITKPLFVVQGLNDPRVPASESEQMVEEIRENGGTVWYLLAKDEGHGFSKKSNRAFYRAATALFLNRFLLESDGSGTDPGSEATGRR